MEVLIVLCLISCLPIGYFLGQAHPTKLDLKIDKKKCKSVGKTGGDKTEWPYGG